MMNEVVKVIRIYYMTVVFLLVWQHQRFRNLIPTHWTRVLKLSGCRTHFKLLANCSLTATGIRSEISCNRALLGHFISNLAT